MSAQLPARLRPRRRVRRLLRGDLRPRGRAPYASLEYVTRLTRIAGAGKPAPVVNKANPITFFAVRLPIRHLQARAQVPECDRSIPATRRQPRAIRRKCNALEAHQLAGQRGQL